jgi:putative ABC transport system substrate-binding protein
MRRRDFLGVLGGAAAAWPVGAWAQLVEPIRRVGILSTQAAGDPEDTTRLARFAAALAELGWSTGRNVRIETRWTAGDVDARRRATTELIALTPDAVLAIGSGATGALLQLSRTVPIVFTFVPDPVGAGFVDSMARPGGNVTGFITQEYGTSGKWLELLKEVMPDARRVVVLRDSATSGGIGQFGALQAVAPSLGVELRPVDMRNAEDIERAIVAFASSPNGGMIVTGSALAVLHRELILGLAARHRIPVISQSRLFVEGGGLISYGAERFEPFRQAAGYVDRILRGARPADLPVQAPTKYELVINMKTAKALGVTVPPALLARADEVIE